MKPQSSKIPLQSTESDDCLSAKELVNRHLQNKDHKISDEDLEKVALDCNDKMEDSTVEVIPNATLATRNDDKEEADNKEEKEVIITPLDVIS